jgi:hypothetical protein
VKLLPIAVHDELVYYFANAECDQGAKSSHEALVAMIERGGPSSGGADPENQITDHRFGWPAHGGECLVGKARRVWCALHALPQGTPHHNVLFAAHGWIQWSGVIDNAFGRGTAAKVVAAVGPHVGVALLTKTARDGFAAAQQARRERLLAAPACEHLSASRSPKPPPLRWKDHRVAWDNEGGWLVATVMVARSRDASASARRDAEEDLAHVRREVAELVANAYEAYAVARGIRLETPEEQARQRSRARTVRLEPSRMPRRLGGLGR